jgi:hypothetical protein
MGVEGATFQLKDLGFFFIDGKNFLATTEMYNDFLIKVNSMEKGKEAKRITKKCRVTDWEIKNFG